MRNTILIVDDVGINRSILKNVFYKEYDIAEASNGQEAIDYVMNNESQIVAILLDIVMPVKDGFEVLDILGKIDLLDHIPVILITGDDSTETEKRGYDVGVFYFIKKPFNAHIVKRRVRNAIELYSHKNDLEVLVEK